jgi:hypothetical protein
MKTLSESLLDDFDTLEKKSDISMYLQEIYNKFDNRSIKKGYDMLGRPLNVGDLVIVNHIGLPFPGLILDINQQHKSCAVSIRGDIEFIKMSHGPQAGQISTGAYYRSSDLSKIDEKILKMLYNIK